MSKDKTSKENLNSALRKTGKRLYEVAELCGWIERWLGYFVKPMLSVAFY